MDLIIRDAWFASHTIVDVGPGEDLLVFERCTFMGGTVHVDLEVDRQIFVACLSRAPPLPRNLCRPASRPIAIGNRQTSRALCQRRGSPDSSQAVRRVAACPIVVNRHPVALGRVVVHPLYPVQHDGRLVQCLSTARTPCGTGNPVASSSPRGKVM